MEDSNNRKVIHNLNLANYLISRGFMLRSIEHNNNRKGLLVFIFDASPELDKEMITYKTIIKEEKNDY